MYDQHYSNYGVFMILYYLKAIRASAPPDMRTIDPSIIMTCIQYLLQHYSTQTPLLIYQTTLLLTIGRFLCKIAKWPTTSQCSSTISENMCAVKITQRPATKRLLFSIMTYRNSGNFHSRFF